MFGEIPSLLFLGDFAGFPILVGAAQLALVRSRLRLIGHFPA